MTDMSNWSDDAVWWGSKARQDAAEVYVKWAKYALKERGFDGASVETYDHGNEIGVMIENQGKHHNNRFKIRHSNRFKIHPNVIADVYRWARDL